MQTHTHTHTHTLSLSPSLSLPLSRWRRDTRRDRHHCELPCTQDVIQFVIARLFDTEDFVWFWCILSYQQWFLKKSIWRVFITVFLFRRAWVNFPLSSSSLCVSHTASGQSAVLCSSATVKHHAPAEVLSGLLFPPWKKCDSSQCPLLWNPADLSGATLSAELACSWPQSLPCVRSSLVRVLYKLDPVYKCGSPVLCYVLKKTWTTCNCLLALRCILWQLYLRVHISQLCVFVCVWTLYILHPCKSPSATCCVLYKL